MYEFFKGRLKCVIEGIKLSDLLDSLMILEVTFDLNTHLTNTSDIPKQFERIMALNKSVVYYCLPDDVDQEVLDFLHKYNIDFN